MNNIDFFSNVGSTVDVNAEEVSIRNSFVEENLFDRNSVPDEYLARFVDEIGHVFGELIDINKLEQFSFQPADMITYHEHKFMAVFSGGKEDYKLFDIDVSNPHDDYCVNYFIDSKTKAAKFYDLDIHRHTKPKLPPGSKPITVWGLGVGATSKKDLYFLHRDVGVVSSFFKLPAPYFNKIDNFCNDTSFMKAFGVTYDAETLEPLKLKMYYYPNDPLMEFTVDDE